jgi:N-acetylglucosaminyl-diphospho-decaprenol L-rhamnosyltransferase
VSSAYENQNPVKVALVIVTYNSAEVVGGLLASIPAGLGDVPGEVIVVDNGSTDNTIDAVTAAAPGASIVATGRNGGYAAGINAGVAAAGQATAVLVLNPDVRLAPGCVPELLEFLTRMGAGIVVPRLDDATGRLIPSQRREPTLLRAVADLILGADRAGRIGTLGEVVTNPSAYTAPARIDWAEGSTMLISTACWWRVGSWDERFFLYSEETDFALRARDAGFECWYIPTARAVHLEGGSSTTPALWRLLVVNKWRLYARRHGRLASALFLGTLILREGSRAALGRPTSRAALAGLLDKNFRTGERDARDISPKTPA